MTVQELVELLLALPRPQHSATVVVGTPHELAEITEVRYEYGEVIIETDEGEARE